MNNTENTFLYSPLSPSHIRAKKTVKYSRIRVCGVCDYDVIASVCVSMVVRQAEMRLWIKKARRAGLPLRDSLQLKDGN